MYYEGRVQGVGFRFTATGIARSHDVSGYVKNLSNGKVELVAQGEEEEISSFLNEISRSMEGYIRSEDTTWHEASGDLDGFSVKY